MGVQMGINAPFLSHPDQIGNMKLIIKMMAIVFSEMPVINAVISVGTG